METWHPPQGQYWQSPASKQANVAKAEAGGNDGDKGGNEATTKDEESSATVWSDLTVKSAVPRWADESKETAA